MRISIVIAAFAVALAPACNKEEKQTAPETTAPETQGATEGEAAEADAPKRPEGPTGTVTGKVTLTGTAPEMPMLQRGADPVCAEKEMKAETVVVGDGGGLANVLVRIKPGTVPAWTPSEPVVVDQVDCMYRPRVQGGVTGQTIQITNSDPTMHNVHARRLELQKRQGTETIVNRAQPAGVPAIEIPIEDQEVVKLKCDSHGWMSAFVVVSDNPYFGVTDETGAFTIEGVPVGEHQFEAWHEFYGVKTGTATVAEDGSVTLDFSYSADDDKPTSAQ